MTLTGPGLRREAVSDAIGPIDPASSAGPASGADAGRDVAAFEDLMPMAKTLGVHSSHSAKEVVKSRLEWSPGLCTAGGLLHGGAVMTLADSTGAACAFLNLPDGASGTTTIESKTNFLRGVRDGHVEATSTPLHVGRSVIVAQTDVHDASQRLVARVLQTQLVLSG
jgi:uncharacterized protein (TIGR00369 family)